MALMIVMVMAGMIVVIVVIIVIIVIIVIVVVSMIIVIAVIVVVSMIVVLAVIMDVHLPVEVLGFSPNDGGTHCSLNRQAATVAKSPFKDSTEQTVEGVMRRAALQVGLQTSMTFDGEDWSEVEVTSLKCFTTAAAMGAMGQNRCRR